MIKLVLLSKAELGRREKKKLAASKTTASASKRSISFKKEESEQSGDNESDLETAHHFFFSYLQFYKVGYDKRTIEKADLTIFLFTFNTDQKIFQVIFYVQ